ncbi:MAG: hypothetical protein GXP34_02025 [Actinobacteria bacterium]|nr:hypothetical protein [Actinomycetota bacterium]
MTAWSAESAGVSFVAGLELAWVARALEDPHVTSVALTETELAFEQVGALTKVGTPESEIDPVERAAGLRVAQTRAPVRRFHRHRPCIPARSGPAPPSGRRA